MARKRGFGQLTKLPSGRIRQTEHGYVPGSPSASRSRTAIGGDWAKRRAGAPASRWGVSSGIAGAGLSQRRADDSARLALAAMRCRSMAR